MKILIIGSEGNIGVPLVQHLKKKGYKVLESDIRPNWRENYIMADMNHAIDLLPAFDWKPDVVFILSAIVSRVTCEQASSLSIATNLSGINNVLQLCKRVNAMTIFFSTSEVYGPNINPMDENIINLQPNNRYGLSKLLGEKLVEYEVRTNGLKAVTLRPFMIYDENEDFGDYRSAMIRFVYNLALGESIEVHLGSARSWLHISDALRAIEAAIHVRKYEVINIGHPDVVPISDLAEMIRNKLDASPKLIKYKNIPSQMTLAKQPVLNKQKKILGVTPRVSLIEGVKRVCDKVKERLLITKKYNKQR